MTDYKQYVNNQGDFYSTSGRNKYYNIDKNGNLVIWSTGIFNNNKDSRTIIPKELIDQYLNENNPIHTAIGDRNRENSALREFIKNKNITHVQTTTTPTSVPAPIPEQLTIQKTTSGGGGTMIPKEELQSKLKQGWKFGKDETGKISFIPPVKKPWTPTRDYKSILEFLKGQGYDIAVDGLYGPQTRKAIMDWQSKNGLQSDGYWGKNTEAKYQQLLNTPPLLTNAEIDKELTGEPESDVENDLTTTTTPVNTTTPPVTTTTNPTTTTPDVTTPVTTPKPKLYDFGITTNDVKNTEFPQEFSDEEIAAMTPSERRMYKNTYKKLKRDNWRERFSRLRQNRKDYNNFEDTTKFLDKSFRDQGIYDPEFYDDQMEHINNDFNLQRDQINEDYRNYKDYYKNQIKRFYKKGGEVKKSKKCRCGCKPTLIKGKGGKVYEKYNCK